MIVTAKPVVSILKYIFAVYVLLSGKSGPLFNFDVQEDIRIKSDAAVEKNESHAGKLTYLIVA